MKLKKGDVVMYKETDSRMVGARDPDFIGVVSAGGTDDYGYVVVYGEFLNVYLGPASTLVKVGEL